MATGTEQVAFVQCDNTSCKRKKYVASNGVAPGIYGSVTRVTASGPDQDLQERVEFYSCSLAPGHIGKAILGALEEPDSVQPVEGSPHDAPPATADAMRSERE